MLGIKPQINLLLLKQHTTYRDELTADSELIQNFWKVLESLDDNKKAQFIDFVYAQKR